MIERTVEYILNASMAIEILPSQRIAVERALLSAVIDVVEGFNGYAGGGFSLVIYLGDDNVYENHELLENKGMKKL